MLKRSIEKSGDGFSVHAILRKRAFCWFLATWSRSTVSNKPRNRDLAGGMVHLLLLAGSVDGRQVSKQVLQFLLGCLLAIHLNFLFVKIRHTVTST